MTTEKQIFAEVKNALKSYDESGLIDEITLRMWLRSEIKSFGTNVMVLTDDIIEVKNGKAKLPDDFWALKEAWKYKPSHFRLNSGSLEDLEKFDYWRTRVIQHGFVNDNDGTCNNECTIKEEVHFKGNYANVYYGSPTLLRLTTGFNKKATTKDCINLPGYVKRQDKNEINILGNTLQTEFRSGFIYIVYRAIPTEDGEIIIPETQHDALYKYLLSFLKLKAMEELWLNNDDPNLGNKISYLYQQSEDYRSRAHTELKAGAISPSSWKTLRNTNRRRHMKYEHMLPKQNF